MPQNVQLLEDVSIETTTLEDGNFQFLTSIKISVKLDHLDSKGNNIYI